MRSPQRDVDFLLLAAGLAAISTLVACAPQPATPTAAPQSPIAVTAPPNAATTPATAVAAAPAATTSAAAAPSPTPLVLNNAQLTAIQPALGTVMIEYSRRMAATYFAEQAGNWDMAKYQVLEMREIQKVGETTRPARAAALKGFETSFLDPLSTAIDNKDTGAFTTAYNNAINGCNSCHASQTSSEFPGSYGFIKVQVPTDNTFESLLQWK